MLNPMEFSGFVIRRFAIPYLGVGGFAIRRIAIPYFLTLNL
nr:hypothetical protein [Prevotella sp.]